MVTVTPACPVRHAASAWRSSAPGGLSGAVEDSTRRRRAASVVRGSITTRSQTGHGPRSPRGLADNPGRRVRAGSRGIQEGKVVSRHRSPEGRRAYHGPPLSALAAAAGSGGAHRSTALPSAFPTPMHAIAAVVVGGTLAAAAQQALTTALPAVDHGIAAARAGFSSAVAPRAATDAVSTVSPVVPEPAVADATSLVKAADLQQAAAQARAKSVAAAAAAAPAAAPRLAPRLAPPAPAAPAAAPRPAVAGGAVRILSGPVTSGFGGRWGTVHQGLDIAAPIGTPIHVPMAGTVISSGPA